MEAFACLTATVSVVNKILLEKTFPLEVISLDNCYTLSDLANFATFPLFWSSPVFQSYRTHYQSNQNSIGKT